MRDNKYDHNTRQALKTLTYQALPEVDQLQNLSDSSHAEMCQVLTAKVATASTNYYGSDFDVTTKDSSHSSNTEQEQKPAQEDDPDSSYSP